jgi:hypothetical protein
VVGQLSPTQRAALEAVCRNALSPSVSARELAEDALRAGYTLGARERQAHDATLVRAVRDLPGNPTTVREMCARAIETSKEQTE